MGDAADKIRDFIATELLFEDPNVVLADDTPLLEGKLDSLALMQLVSFLEDEFEADIADGDITVENFRTIGDIERLVTTSARP